MYDYEIIEDALDSHLGDFEDFEDFEDDETYAQPKKRDVRKSKGDLEYGEPLDEPKIEKTKKTKKIKERSNVRPDYVDEHYLSIAMTMFKNWDGHLPKSIIFEDPWKINRARYDLALAKYESLRNEGLDKRNQEVQKAFTEALTLAIGVFPNDKEIGELYRMMKSICSRCIPIYGRNYNLELDDVIGITFERWIKYKHNFDPLKRSEISGTRVNAFAYMTQLIKNTIYELVNKANAKASLEEKLRGDMALYESFNPVTPTIFSDDENNQNQKDYVSNETAETKDYQDSHIIRVIMERVSNHNRLTDLIMEIETTGYTRDEILTCIGEYDLLEPLNEILTRNIWGDF